MFSLTPSSPIDYSCDCSIKWWWDWHNAMPYGMVSFPLLIYAILLWIHCRHWYKDELTSCYLKTLLFDCGGDFSSFLSQNRKAIIVILFFFLLLYFFYHVFNKVLPENAWKVASIKTKSATIAFFSSLLLSSPLSFFSSFPVPSLLWFWSLSRLSNLPFEAFSPKWLQISLGWFSRNRLDIHLCKLC